MSFSYPNSGQLNSLFVNAMFPDGDIIGPLVWSLKKFKYWCLSDIKNKLLSKISWGTRGTQMKYECLPWISFSYSEIFTVVFSECCGSCVLCAGWHLGMNFSAVIWFGRHSKWIALISQEHCYLDCWMKMKYCMMQVSERSVEMLLSVWCSWQF